MILEPRPAERAIWPWTPPDLRPRRAARSETPILLKVTLRARLSMTAVGFANALTPRALAPAAALAAVADVATAEPPARAAPPANAVAAAAIWMVRLRAAVPRSAATAVTSPAMSLERLPALNKTVASARNMANVSAMPITALVIMSVEKIATCIA